MVFASCFQTSKPLLQFVTPIEDLRVLSWVNDPLGRLPDLKGDEWTLRVTFLGNQKNDTWQKWHRPRPISSEQRSLLPRRTVFLQLDVFQLGAGLRVKMFRIFSEIRQFLKHVQNGKTWISRTTEWVYYMPTIPSSSQSWQWTILCQRGFFMIFPLSQFSWENPL